MLLAFDMDTELLKVVRTFWANLLTTLFFV